MPNRTKSATLKQELNGLRKQVAHMGRMLMLGAGELSASRLNYLNQSQAEKPDAGSFKLVVERCRYFARESQFISTQWLPLKLAVCNHGFRLVPASVKGKTKKPSAKDQQAIDDWLGELSQAVVDQYTDPATSKTVEVESTSTRAEVIEKFAKAAWTDRILLNNVVAQWTEGVELPITLPLEKCTYTDVFGVEVLKYEHGLSRAQIAQLPEEQQQVFNSGASITVNPADGFHFKVLKEGAPGTGFALPRMYSIFRLLGEVESKEFGYNAMSFAFRSAKRVHLIGHEIKNGPNAGKPFHFFKKERAKAGLAKWVDIVGFEDYYANFDEKITFPWPDPKLFDQTVWEGSDRRLAQWGGPVMQMLLARGVTPYLPNLLRASIGSERAEMGRFLSSVINLSLNPPVPVEVSWSNAIFNESRLAAELIKFGVQQGFISATTATEEAGQSRDRERARKLSEVGESDADKTLLPAWDASHGTAPALGERSTPAAPDANAKGANPGSRSGRKPGSPDTK